MPKREETQVISENISIVIKPVNVEETIFKIKRGWDWNKFGWLIPAVCQNLEYIIHEKTSKIDDYKANYRQWWLVLFDTINIHLEPHEHRMLESHNFDKGPFEEVIVIGKSAEEIFRVT